MLWFKSFFSQVFVCITLQYPLTQTIPLDLQEALRLRAISSFGDFREKTPASDT